MVERNIDIEKFICLKTGKELSKPDRKLWLDIIGDFGPEDIISSVQIYTEDGLVNKKLLIKKNKDEYEYIVPLTRDLLTEEAEKIVEAWDAYFNDEFEIESSTPIYENKIIEDENEDSEEANDLEKFAEELSKLNHKFYIKKLQDMGYRYGDKYSVTDKTSPDILPWEQLTDKNKEINFQYAQEVIELLEKLGYSISEEEE